jgi:hypothetical protein
MTHAFSVSQKAQRTLTSGERNSPHLPFAQTYKLGSKNN